MGVQSEYICVNAIVYLSMNKSLIYQQAWSHGANSWQKSVYSLQCVFHSH